LKTIGAPRLTGAFPNPASYFKLKGG
jgi:hypothetical protein